MFTSIKNRTGIIKLMLFLFIIGCATSDRKRQLSHREMKQYHLNGIINDARICPTIYINANQPSQVNGPCESVTCEQKGKEVICWAQPVK